MTPDRLPVPLAMLEGVLLTEPRDLAKLYARISSMIGCDVPVVNFDAISEEFKALEVAYTAQIRDEAAADQPHNRDSIVRDPRVLCISSEQYLEMGFANQLQTVLDAFPKHLRHDIVTTSSDLMKILGSQQVDVVHIAAYVCPRSGTLYFSRVTLPLGDSASENTDFIRAEALAMLLGETGARLVVIASGDSLALATLLLPFTNVISPRDIITANSMAVWVRTFYAALRDETIAEACVLASAQSGASMKLLTKQVASDMSVTFGSDAVTKTAQ